MDQKNKSEEEIARYSASIISNELDPIEGCRLILELWYGLEEESNDDINYLIAIESDSEHFPCSNNRELYSPSYLETLDLEKEKLLASEYDNIKEVCISLMHKYRRGEFKL
ncbi:hypothetical protein FEF65_07120 [Mariprofundus erugo]|uniref:Uncharacterized protein n=1 Tax=Mariprofundus erugo TaxID=2528639 RepID=A0A5R9GL20_9PROT|nr:hypothetical protein [Mariprofundus erugo]TLS67206.1 hypothetical protein FEF65_07120 [Mariprofundus erugo]